MPTRIRKLNLFQRFQNRKQVCYICGKAPADHWSYITNSKGQFISEPRPKYFHLKCALNEMDRRSTEAKREMEEAFKDIKKEVDSGS